MLGSKYSKISTKSRLKAGACWEKLFSLPNKICTSFKERFGAFIKAEIMCRNAKSFSCGSCHVMSVVLNWIPNTTPLWDA